MNEWIVMEDKYPVTEGHSLIIPKRHVESVGELTQPEFKRLSLMISMTKSHLRTRDDSIKGFNIGINEGVVAGQTIPHLHIHVIPRREGDMDDPTGGVRGVIPDKQKY
jgi:diadenosine tetraphosphate (Ap4A) HIT family hydrolase